MRRTEHDDAGVFRHVARKALNLKRAQSRRGDLAAADGAAEDLAIADEEVWIDSLTEECRELLSVLDPQLREIALMKLEGYTNEEIAERKDRSVRTIERYMEMIRGRWEQADA